MTGLTTTDGLFFGKAGLNRTRVEGLVEDSMTGADDGELFLEYRQSESLTFDDGQLKNASYDTLQGFGLRTVAGDATGYAHASSLDEGAIKRASKTVQAV
ncbi:MAG: metalloprotease TldD, partial [Rhodospirillales bacterium]|nr:metalloprotease TldD [Rhodospirillales bacterium]